MRGKAIVPGCGSGHDVRLLAAHGLEVVGLDIAPTAVARARARPTDGKAVYVRADWLDLPEQFHGRFDWVVEHTCFCALQPSLRPAYVTSVVRALKPGGAFLAVFYREPASVEGPPFGVTDAELERLFDGFRLEERARPEAAYPSRVGREEIRLYRLP